MATKKSNLVIVAHPDDETIFLGGWILAQRTHPWHVICVTDGGADDRREARRRELEAATQALKVAACDQWDFPDIYEERLNQADLARRLRSLPKPNAVYTHGPLGEYGHPHHQDVSMAVTLAFARVCPVWQFAYNARPERNLVLTPAQYAKKLKILSEIYRLETERFVDFLPATWSEGLVRASLSETTAWFNFIVHGQKPISRQLKHWAWLLRIKAEASSASRPRPF